MDHLFDAETEDYAITTIKHKARQLVGRTGFSESDRADLEQELMLDLLGRLPNYDAARSQITTFISRVVENKLRSICEARFRQKRDPRRLAGSLNQRIESGEGGSVERVDTIDQEEYWRRRGTAGPCADVRDLAVELRPVLASLPDDMRELAEWLASTSNISEISRETGTPRWKLYEALAALRARLEDAGLGDYL